MKKTALSQFSRDLADPSAGLNTDLYKAISPMVGGGVSPDEKGPEAESMRHLHDQLRKGLVSMDYLTGLKKNTGETFYDEHPVQAVTSDLASNAPLIGGGLAAGGMAANLLRQHHNMKMTEPSRMSSDKNPLDPNNVEELLNPQKGPARADISKVFGDFETNPETRLKTIDQLNNKLNPSGASSLHGEHDLLKKELAGHGAAHEQKMVKLMTELKKASPNRARAIQTEMAGLKAQMEHGTTQTQKKINELFARAKQSSGASSLPDYARVHEALKRSKEKGGLKKYVGEFLHAPGGGKIREFLRKHLAPGKDQAIGDILEKYKVTGSQPHYNEELLKEILKHHGGGKDLHSTPGGKAFMDSTLKNIGDPSHQSSGLAKALSRHKLPLAAGGAVALGGLGLHQLLKAIQNQAYSKDKQNEWKKTLLKSRGDFDAANQIQ
jgi:hypothetical protein